MPYNYDDSNDSGYSTGPDESAHKNMDQCSVPAYKQYLGTYVAIDCKLIGVQSYDGRKSALGRVSLVNWHGYCVYSTFVRTNEVVYDFRTSSSGVEYDDWVNEPSYEEVCDKISELVRGRILVGHRQKMNLNYLEIDHPEENIRDVALWDPFRQQFGYPIASLRKTAQAILDISIQRRGRPHDSIEDACAAMSLYRHVHYQWKRSLRED